MKHILIDFYENIIKTALVDDGRLVEVLVDKKDAASIVGNVYVGIVQNIAPNQFAFVDIGQEKNAFLHLNDSKEAALYEGGKLILKTGQTIAVQVLKDASGTKGAAVTTQLSFAGKHMVLFSRPESEIGISKKIESMGERRRLKAIGEKLVNGSDIGLILRTDSQDKPEDVLAEEFGTIKNTMEKVLERAKYAKAPAMVYKDRDLLDKALRAFLDISVERIVLNDERWLESVKSIAESLNWQGIFSLHVEPVPLLGAYGVASQLEKALSPKVWLPSGGFLIIEQTEACVVIDVNTGKFTGESRVQNAAVKTNREAAKEIARQLRLRNLSGMIVIDFIDMKKHPEQEALVHLLEEEVKQDRLGVSVLGMTYLGVVMLTRKMEREPLARLLQKTCPCCKGAGRISG